jgi:hypothetical protein
MIRAIAFLFTIVLCTSVGAQTYTDSLQTTDAMLTVEYFDETPQDMIAYTADLDSGSVGAHKHVLVQSSFGMRMAAPVAVSRMQVNVMPNPTSSDAQLVVRFPDAELHISIINTLGQIVWQESFVTITETEWAQQLDVRNLQAGLYLIQIRGTQEVLHVPMVKK